MGMPSSAPTTTAPSALRNMSWARRREPPYYPARQLSGGPTVFNLGYTPEVAEKWPHVARLSVGFASGHPR